MGPITLLQSILLDNSDLEVIWYHFTAMKYYITSRVSFLVTALSHWYPHIICNKANFLFHSPGRSTTVSLETRNPSFTNYLPSRVWKIDWKSRLLEKIARLQVEHGGKGFWVDVLNVVVTCESLPSGYRKARCIILERTLYLTLSGKVMLVTSVE